VASLALSRGTLPEDTELVGCLQPGVLVLNHGIDGLSLLEVVDSGVRWTRLPRPDEIRSVAVDPVRKQLYACTERELLRISFPDGMCACMPLIDFSYVIDSFFFVMFCIVYIYFFYLLFCSFNSINKNTSNKVLKSNQHNDSNDHQKRNSLFDCSLLIFDLLSSLVCCFRW